VLLDRDGVKITYTGITRGNIFTEINLRIENNSSISVGVQTRNESVNGFMVYGFMSQTVAPNTTEDTDVTFLNSSLTASGITSVNEVQLNFIFINPPSFATVFTSDLITIRLFAPTSPPPVAGTLLMEHNGVKITYTGLTVTSSYNEINLYIENNSGISVGVQTRNEYVNGISMSGIMSQSITPGNRAHTTQSFFNSSLAENGITSINEVQFNFIFFNPSTFATTFTGETITIKP
jgi:hypothetical protein